MRSRAPVMALLAHTVVVQALTMVLRPTMAYRAIELGVPTSQLGLLAASFAVLPLLLALFVGRLTDRVGERTPLWSGAVLMTSSAVGLVLWNSSLTALLLWSVVLGVGHLLMIVGEQTTVTHLRGKGGLDAAFGRYTLFASVGQVVGPTLLTLFGGAGAIPETSRIFGVGVVLAALAVLMTALMRPAGSAARALHPPATSLRGALRVPRRVLGELCTGIGASLVIVSAIDLLVVYLPALGAQAGIGAGTVGILLALRAVASAVSRIAVGRLVAAIGRVRLLWTSLAASAAATALIPIPMPVSVLAVVMVAAGLALGIGQPLTMAWVTEAAPRGARGTWLALRLSGNRLGQTAVPAVAGLAAASAGVGGVLWVMAAGLGAAAALVARRRGPER